MTEKVPINFENEMFQVLALSDESSWEADMTCVFYVLLSAGWFCSEECSHDREEIDHVLEHSQSLLLELLLVAANHDCVREGGGPGMIRMWTSLMVQF